MVLYRRNLVPGGTYFFTVTLADRGSDRLVRHIGLREAFRTARRERPFRIDAIVVLPDHLHAVWTLPPDDADYPARWQRIKADFSRRVAAVEPTLAKNRRGEYRLWQRRYWEHTIRMTRTSPATSIMCTSTRSSMAWWSGCGTGGSPRSIST